MTELDEKGLNKACEAWLESASEYNRVYDSVEAAIKAYLAALSSKSDGEVARVFVLSDDHYDLLEKLTPDAGDEREISTHDSVFKELVFWGLAYTYEDGDYNTHAAISLSGLKTLRGASKATKSDPAQSQQHMRRADAAESRLKALEVKVGEVLSAYSAIGGNAPNAVIERDPRNIGPLLQAVIALKNTLKERD